MVFAPASLTLTNYFLPLSEALVLIGVSVVLFLILFFIFVFLILFVYTKHKRETLLAVKDPINVAGILVIFIGEAEGEINNSYKRYILNLFKNTFSLSDIEALKLYALSQLLLKEKYNVMYEFRRAINEVITQYSYEQLESLNFLINSIATYPKKLSELQTSRLNEVNTLLLKSNKSISRKLSKPSWCNKSLAIDNLNVEIMFLLQDKFTSGGCEVQLKSPVFQRVVESMARTCEVSDNESELILYYKSIIGHAIEQQLSFNEIRHYFWLRLWLWNSDKDIHISFPWYDNLSLMVDFFSWLKYKSHQTDFYDSDQGWSIEASLIEGFLYIRQSDGEEEEIYNIVVSYEPLIDSINIVERRAMKIIRLLSQECGDDVWTTYKWDAELSIK